jgi:hypothetical protein
MKGKQYSWKDIKVTLGGVELHGIKSMDFVPNYSLEQLHANLKEAEQKEDYELCIEIQNLIDNYKD